MRAEVTEGPGGAFEEQVLVAVLRLSSDAYGMNVRREIERVTGRDLSIGAVYATLDRLESKRLLTSSRVGSDGPTRRLFQLSAEGARALAATNSMRERLWDGVNLKSLGLMAR